MYPTGRHARSIASFSSSVSGSELTSAAKLESDFPTPRPLFILILSPSSSGSRADLALVLFRPSTLRGTASGTGYPSPLSSRTSGTRTPAPHVSRRAYARSGTGYNAPHDALPWSSETRRTRGTRPGAALPCETGAFLAASLAQAPSCFVRPMLVLRTNPAATVPTAETRFAVCVAHATFLFIGVFIRGV